MSLWRWLWCQKILGVYGVLKLTLFIFRFKQGKKDQAKFVGTPDMFSTYWQWLRRRACLVFSIAASAAAFFLWHIGTNLWWHSKSIGCCLWARPLVNFQYSDGALLISQHWQQLYCRGTLLWCSRGQGQQRRLRSWWGNVGPYGIATNSEQMRINELRAITWIWKKTME